MKAAHHFFINICVASGSGEMEGTMRKKAFFIYSMENSGGTERVVANLVNEWISQGCDVSLIVATGGGKSFYQLNPKVKVLDLHMQRLAPLKVGTLPFVVLGYLKIIKKLYTCLKENQIDLLLNIWTNMSLCGIIAGKIAGIRTIACEHIWYYSASWYWRSLRRLIYPFATGVVSLTEIDKTLYERFARNVACIPNANYFYSTEKVNYENMQVLAIGRLTYQKGFDLLIDAWSKVMEYYSNWKLVIVGGGEDYDKLLSIIKTKGCQQSIIMQPPTSNVIQHYLDSSIYVMPSRYEGFPMVLLEAMSVGLPIVSFDCPTGPKELLDAGQYGLLVKNGDINDLSVGLNKLISNLSLREEFGLKSKKRIQNYSQEKINLKWMEYLKKIDEESN